jgi:hypothetical protein
MIVLYPSVHCSVGTISQVTYTFVRRIGLVVGVLDSRPGDPGTNLSPAKKVDSYTILGQDVYSYVLRPTMSFISPESINGYHLRLGLASSVRLQRQRMARLAAVSGTKSS